jgi:hypothetical protein
VVMFVHLTPESQARRIRRTGLGRLRKAWGGRPGGFYALPVTANYHVMHQWVRELRRHRNASFVAVLFRIGDSERVWVGRYNQTHREMTAAAAASLFHTGEGLAGWEVIIPRRIEPREIHAIRRVSQLVGWRFSPESKGKPPFCGCKFCTRGEYGARRLRERLGAEG